MGSSSPNIAWAQHAPLFSSSTSYFLCNCSHACLVSWLALVGRSEPFEPPSRGPPTPTFINCLLHIWSSHEFVSVSVSLSLSLWLSRPRAVHDHPDKGIKSGLDLYMSPRSLLAPNNRQPLPTRRGTLIIPKPPSVCLFMNPRLLMTMGPSSLLPPSPPPAD